MRLRSGADSSAGDGASPAIPAPRTSRGAAFSQKAEGSSSCGAKRIRTPQSPTNRPNQPRRVSRSPPGQNISNRPIHNGVLATRTAVTPLGTFCMASVTRPLPATKRSRLLQRIRPQSWRDSDSRSRRQAKNPRRSTPARHTRVPPNRAGGKCSLSTSTPTRMAQYVVPHEI